MRTTWLAVALLLVFVGCGDGPSGKNNGNNGTNGGTNNGTTNGGTNNGTTNGGTNNGTTNNNVDTDLQRLEDGSWDAVCEAMFQCPNRNTVQLIVFLGGRFATEAECKASALRGDVDVAQSQLGLDEGRVVLDPAKVDDCTASFKTVSCDPAADPSPIEAACDGLWTGQVAEGDNCALNEECADGNFCDIGDMECYGACTVPTPPDATCGNETCNLETEYCGQQGNMRRCVDRKVDGQACQADDECMDGSGCLQVVGGQLCTAYGSQMQGEACGGDTQYCATDLVCTGQMVQRCTALTFGGDGESCNLSGAACDPGLACLDLTLAGGTCGVARAENEDCQLSFQCQFDLYCDGFDFAMPQVPGTCLPRKADGAVCDEDGDCGSEFCARANPDDPEGTCEAETYCAVP